MNIEDVKEWMEIADNDFDSAILLNESVRKHYEIICYHCAQTVEKHIKGYLISKNIIPQKTHESNTPGKAGGLFLGTAQSGCRCLLF